MHGLPPFHVSEISNFPRFTSLECLKKEQFSHKMVCAERLLVSTSFVMYYHHHLLVSHQTKTNICIALQNENHVSYLTIIANKRQMVMPYGGRNHKLHFFQTDTLKNCDE
jgi:hypothetical protein